MTASDSFQGVAEFIAVGETSGFSAAARKLGVSTSHVSRQVALLEERLGVVLLARTTRRVRLTEIGSDYFLRCQELMNGLLEANEGLQSHQIKLSGVLRVSAAGEFAVRYVAPRLIEFSKMHPELSIDLNFNSRVVDFIEEGIDFAIRYGKLSDSGLIARRLATRSLVAVASQEYLHKHGEPKHPRELKNHRCLIANSDRWLFQDEGEMLEVRLPYRWKCNEVRTLAQACQQGLGICYLPRSSLAESLLEGDLIEILSDFHYRDATTWIVYANRRYLPARARQAIEYLVDSFDAWQE